jgi:pimeloyl-ACP methyl ester carboxylesterase
LLFVPGWCCDHTFFAPQFDYFKSTHTVTALALRGCGHSDSPTDGYEIPRAPKEDRRDDVLRRLTRRPCGHRRRHQLEWRRGPDDVQHIAARHSVGVRRQQRPVAPADAEPDAHFGVTVGAGHFHQLEVPEQVNAMIDRSWRSPSDIRPPAARYERNPVWQ